MTSSVSSTETSREVSPKIHNNDKSNVVRKPNPFWCFFYLLIDSIIFHKTPNLIVNYTIHAFLMYIIILQSNSSKLASISIPIILHLNNQVFMEKQEFIPSLAYPLGMLVLYIFSLPTNCSIAINFILVIMSMVNGPVTIPFIFLNFLYLNKKETANPLILYCILNMILSILILYNYKPQDPQQTSITMISSLTYLFTLLLLRIFGRNSKQRIVSFCYAGVLATLSSPMLFSFLSKIFTGKAATIRIDTLLCSSFLYILMSIQVFLPIVFTIVIIVLVILFGIIHLCGFLVDILPKVMIELLF